MFYHLLFPLSEQWTIFNLLRYISFRSIAAFFTAFLIGVVIAPWFIRLFQKMKVGQSIRDDGPQSHLKKAGTPTMGGVFIILASLASVLLWSRFNFYVLLSGLALLLFGGIGFVDDYLKVKEKDTKGVSARLKLVLQGLVSAALMLMLYFYTQSWDSNTFHVVIKDSRMQTLKEIPYGWQTNNTIALKTGEVGVYSNTLHFVLQVEDYFRIVKEKELVSINVDERITEVKMELSPSLFETQGDFLSLSWQMLSYDKQGRFVDQKNGNEKVHKKSRFFQQFYLPYYSKPIFTWPLILAFIFYVVVLMSFSNATNLSDGLDGLASGMGIMLFIPFGVFAYIMGNSISSEYLLFPFLSGGGELTVVIAAFIGGLVSFLWYNVHPAQVFMGDTGSLAMGGLIATIAVSLKQEVLLVVAGGMFVLEAFSVVLQVFWYKRFKKRIFKMSPIHHHFELSGWKETQVVARFWILSALFAIIALSALKIR